LVPLNGAVRIPEAVGVAPDKSHSNSAIPQLSVAFIPVPVAVAVFGTIAEQPVLLAQTVKLATQPPVPGPLSTGGRLSTTVTVNEQKAWLFCASVALAITVVDPKPKVIPFTVVKGKVTPPSVLYLIDGVEGRQLSCAVASHKLLLCV
jgi:hypothetical protein